MRGQNRAHQKAEAVKVLPSMLLALMSFAGRVEAFCDAVPSSGAILIGSSHIGANYEFNEQNLGLFLGWGCGSWEWRAGSYKNSLEDTSLALTFTHDKTTVDGGWVSVGLFAGAAYYGDSGDFEITGLANWIPIGGIEATLEPVKYAPALFVQYIPGNVEWAGYRHLVTYGVRMNFPQR